MIMQKMVMILESSVRSKEIVTSFHISARKDKKFFKKNLNNFSIDRT